MIKFWMKWIFRPMVVTETTRQRGSQYSVKKSKFESFLCIPFFHHLLQGANVGSVNFHFYPERFWEQRSRFRPINFATDIALRNDPDFEKVHRWKLLRDILSPEFSAENFDHHNWEESVVEFKKFLILNLCPDNLEPDPGARKSG